MEQLELDPARSDLFKAPWQAMMWGLLYFSALATLKFCYELRLLLIERA